MRGEFKETIQNPEVIEVVSIEIARKVFRVLATNLEIKAKAQVQEWGQEVDEALGDSLDDMRQRLQLLCSGLVDRDNYTDLCEYALEASYRFFEDQLKSAVDSRAVAQSVIQATDGVSGYMHVNNLLSPEGETALKAYKESSQAS